MRDVGPFCIVTVVCLLGSTNLYYAFGLYDPFRCFSIMYRLIVFSELSPDELENKFASDMRIGDDGTIVQRAAERTENYYYVQTLMFFIGFVMSIALMNLFIAVLSVSYKHWRDNAMVGFSQHQARKLLEAQAMSLGWRHFI